MNKKLLFTFPLVVSSIALFSCNNKESVTKITATVPSTNVYRRGDSISKNDITVTADTNNGSKIIASKDWTSDKFGSNATYTFTASGTNVIDVKYGGQTCNLDVSVSPKGSTDFTFKGVSEAEPFKIKVDETKTLEITMKEEGAEVDISKVEWSIEQGSTDPDAIQITADATNKFKCDVKGLKSGVTTINVKATDTVGNSKTNSLIVDVSTVDPEYIKYLEFSVYSNEICVEKKSGGTLPKDLVIPDKVKGKYIKNYKTEGLEAETDYNVTWIARYGFAYTNISSVLIPNTINTIQEQAFNLCSSLSSVTFAANSVLKSINEFAFYSCSSLTSISLPDSLEALQNDVFSGSGITAFTIPSKVTSIGESALANESTSLTSLSFADTTGTWIIDPAEKSFEKYSIDTPTKNAEKYNSGKKRWVKNQLSILLNNKSQTTLKKGENGTVSFADPLAGETIDNVLTSDDNKLEITENEGWKFNAKASGTAKIVLESDYGRYGLLEVTITESLTGTVTIACPTPGVGQVITATVTGAQTTNLKYTWYSSSSGSEPLYESTSNTYTLVATDNYSYFSLEVTDSTGEYIGKITSNDLYISW